MPALVAISAQLPGWHIVMLCHPQKHGKARGIHITLLKSAELHGQEAKQRMLQEVRQQEASTTHLLQGTCNASTPTHNAVCHAQCYHLTRAHAQHTCELHLTCSSPRQQRKAALRTALWPLQILAFAAVGYGLWRVGESSRTKELRDT